jgi:hypothetical protein
MKIVLLNFQFLELSKSRFQEALNENSGLRLSDIYRLLISAISQADAANLEGFLFTVYNYNRNATLAVLQQWAAALYTAKQLESPLNISNLVS